MPYFVEGGKCGRKKKTMKTRRTHVGEGGNTRNPRKKRATKGSSVFVPGGGGLGRGRFLGSVLASIAVLRKLGTIF